MRPEDDHHTTPAVADADIEAARRPFLRIVEEADILMRFSQGLHLRARAIRREPVDDEDLDAIAGIALGKDGVNAASDRPRFVEHRDDDGDQGKCFVLCLSRQQAQSLFFSLAKRWL